MLIVHLVKILSLKIILKTSYMTKTTLQGLYVTFNVALQGYYYFNKLNLKSTASLNYHSHKATGQAKQGAKSSFYDRNKFTGGTCL